MPVRSDVIAHGQFSALATQSDIFTVPAQRLAIVKDLAWTQTGITNAAVTLQVVRAGVGVPVYGQTINANTVSVDKDRFIVAEEGDILRLFKELTSSVGFHLSGALLVITP